MWVEVLPSYVAAVIGLIALAVYILLLYVSNYYANNPSASIPNGVFYVIASFAIVTTVYALYVNRVG